MNSLISLRCGMGLVTLLTSLYSTLLAQNTSPAIPSRETITARIADLRKISTPEGIEALEPVEIGGTKQWISIRGLNRANPVLLMIHGGPGSPMMPSSWAFQTPWEDFFTVVQWDQRGVGKNAVAADHQALIPTMTMDRMVQDTEEMVAHLRKRLGKEKIVVMGFSWGTVLGTHLAAKRPEWLHAYVGVGQAGAGTDEKYIYSQVMELARKAKNEQAIKELQAIAPYPHPNNDTPIEKALAVRKWARVYNGGWYGRTDFDLYFALPDWAPEYTQADVEAHLKAMSWAGKHLMDDLNKDDLTKITTFKTPVIFMMGRYDLHTPYEPAKAYFDRIKAPHKRFISFERSAHFLMFEEPGRFLLALVNEVLPLTGKPVSFKPLP